MVPNLKLKSHKTEANRATLVQLLLLILAFWLQSSSAIDWKGRSNPVVYCGLQDTFGTLPYNCTHGGYIINADPQICRDRYLCYLGPGDTCKNSEETRCAPGLVCSCNMCQNCDNKSNCKVNLCPPEINILKRWMKRFEQKVLDYGS